MNAPKKKLEALKIAIENTININSMEQYTDTPDWVIAEYLVNCYKSFENLNSDRSVLLQEKG